VWFELDLGEKAASILADGLARLKNDHESGARQLAGVALRVFIDVLRALDPVDETTWWANSRLVAWHLWKNGRETMGAPILSLLLASLDVVRQTDDVGTAVARLEDLARERDSSTSKIAGAFATLLHEYPEDEAVRIVTLSASSTVTACLEHALTTLPRRLDLRVLESRPLYEGAGLARKLAAFAASRDIVSKMDVTVFTDAAAGVASQGADLLLLGADLIDRHGNVSNKTGSLPAVLAARHVCPEVKVVVVSEKEKVLPFEPPGHEENDGSEVTAAWDGAGVRREDGDDIVNVRNVYFEWVDSGLVDAYVTDEGVSSTEDVMRWAEDIERRANDVFDGL
jgi:translation initiation factor 2B subunit (eIF-2B alpha/beta/delta family)